VWWCMWLVLRRHVGKGNLVYAVEIVGYKYEIDLRSVGGDVSYCDIRSTVDVSHSTGRA
jgi:hypothetical protein